jgi:hypothetical protein
MLMRRRVLCFAIAAALAASAARAQPAFPVKYSSDSRHLVDQAGTPFPIMGRTAWFVISLNAIDYRTFVDDTASRGYNTIEFHVLNHDPRGYNEPFNGDGDLPFSRRLNGAAWTGNLTYGNINAEAPDFTAPNENYWSFVDGFVGYCESKGILVLMFPAYVGYAGGEQGWMKEMVANGPSRMQMYGAWLATRYKNQKNIVWMMGGDLGGFNTEQTAAENALLTGLKSMAGQQSVQFSAEWDSNMIATDQPTFGSSMTLNGVYTFNGDVNSHGRRAYGRSPVIPAFLLEEPYDEEGPDGNSVNPSATQPVRRFQWWGWLSTIGGYVSGNGYIWPFNSPWRTHLDTAGSRDMARLNGFIRSIGWYELVPSGLGGMRTLIIAGGSTPSMSTYVAAAASLQGTLLVAYVPPAHGGTFTVDMRAMAGVTHARWFDPTNATYIEIGSNFANTGQVGFTTPGNNSAGTTDWVLVLTSRATITPPAAPSNLRIIR